MKATYYINGKKISKKAIADEIGKERIDRLTAEAKDGFRADPLEQQSFYLGSYGMLTIEFA